MLYSFIVSILPDTDAAQDVLQETNVVLLEKANEFRPDLHFPTWACKIARFQVRAYLRDRGRNRMMFVGQLFDEIAEEAVTQLAEYKGRLEALERCLQKLPAHDRTLLEARYAEGGSVQALAIREGKSVNAISRMLYRLRGLLTRCMRQSIGAEVLR